MSTVALPTPTTGPAPRAEADLLRRAARSDRDAFDELYRHHSQMSWRLAQAVSADATQAGEAVADGFAQVLRGIRRRRTSTDHPFRPVLLGAVYRSAIDQARQTHAKAGPPPAKVDASPADGAAKATLASFRSLPERWRAALWLAEVEHLAVPSFAAILGVSDPVAAQLTERGRQGLLARFAQAGLAVPEHLDEVLRPLATGLPATLEALTAKRWKSSVTADAAGRLAPASEWLAERAPRPLWIACGGLVALGVVGLGVLTVASPPAQSGPAAAISAPPPAGGGPVNPSGPGNHNLLLGPHGAGQSPFLLSTDAANTGAAPSAASSLAAGQAGAAAAATPNASSGSTAPAGSSATPGTTPTTPSGPGTPAGTNPSGPPTGVTPAPPAAAKSIVTVPNVAGVSAPPSGGVSATVGSPGNPAATITLSPTCTGIQVLNITTNTCVNPASSVTSPVSSLLGNLLGGLGIK